MYEPRDPATGRARRVRSMRRPPEHGDRLAPRPRRTTGRSRDGRLAGWGRARRAEWPWIWRARRLAARPLRCAAGQRRDAGRRAGARWRACRAGRRCRTVGCRRDPRDLRAASRSAERAGDLAARAIALLERIAERSSARTRSGGRAMPRASHRSRSLAEIERRDPRRRSGPKPSRARWSNSSSTTPTTPALAMFAGRAGAAPRRRRDPGAAGPAQGGPRGQRPRPRARALPRLARRRSTTDAADRLASRARPVVPQPDPPPPPDRQDPGRGRRSSPDASPRSSPPRTQGASVRAALPTLRRSVGLCPRCAQPYTGVAEACPRCLRRRGAPVPSQRPPSPESRRTGMNGSAMPDDRRQMVRLTCDAPKLPGTTCLPSLTRAQPSAKEE